MVIPVDFDEAKKIGDKLLRKAQRRRDVARHDAAFDFPDIDGDLCEFDGYAPEEFFTRW
jgi:hypothetical protein